MGTSTTRMASRQVRRPVSPRAARPSKLAGLCFILGMILGCLLVISAYSGLLSVHTTSELSQARSNEDDILGTYQDLSQADMRTQLRVKFRRLPPYHAIAPDSDIFLTFSNGHYSTLMLNAAALVADLGRPLVVLAFDNATAVVCEDYGLPYIWAGTRMDEVDFRQDRSKFLLMGAQKPVAVVRLFDELHARTVALIDTDTVWLRDPFGWLQGHPDADLFVTTDCLSHEAEVYNRQYPRCGHVRGGQGSGWALNTGVTIWRNTPGSHAFASLWHEHMSNNSLHEQGVDDQLSFNQLVTSEVSDGGRLQPKAFPLRRVKGDDRVLYAGPGDKVKLMVLPTVAFAGGKTMFYSHLPELYGQVPYAVHATFQRYNNNGKIARFREAGAFLLDSPAYYQEGTFLAYDNLVLPFVEAVEGLADGELTLLHKQVLAAAYQLAAFRDAAALAKALQRILILPPVYAFCDSDHSITIMAKCSFEGADQQAPWRAPADLIFNIDVLEDGSEYMPYRMPGFLENPRTPLPLRWSRSTLWHHFEMPEGTGNALNTYATGPLLGTTNQSALLAAVEDVQARVLRIGNLQPGMFSTFQQDVDNIAFNTWFQRMMYDMKWCCSTQDPTLKQQRYDGIDYMPAAALSLSGPDPFQLPAFSLPSHCLNPTVRSKLEQEWGRPLQYRMHPCNLMAESLRLPQWGGALWTRMLRLQKQRGLWPFPMSHTFPDS